MGIYPRNMGMEHEQRSNAVASSAKQQKLTYYDMTNQLTKHISSQQKNESASINVAIKLVMMGYIYTLTN